MSIPACSPPSLAPLAASARPYSSSCALPRPPAAMLVEIDREARPLLACARGGEAQHMSSVALPHAMHLQRLGGRCRSTMSPRSRVQGLKREALLERASPCSALFWPRLGALVAERHARGLKAPWICSQLPRPACASMLRRLCWCRTSVRCSRGDDRKVFKQWRSGTEIRPQSKRIGGRSAALRQRGSERDNMVPQTSSRCCALPMSDFELALRTCVRGSTSRTRANSEYN